MKRQIGAEGGAQPAVAPSVEAREGAGEGRPEDAPEEPSQEPLREPQERVWRHIGDRGEERDAQGLLWAPAPPWRGMRAEWVREGRSADGSVGPVVYVVIASRTHRNARGRMIFKGEIYSDRATREWHARQEQDHLRMLARTSIPTDPLPQWLFDLLSGTNQDDTMYT